MKLYYCIIYYMFILFFQIETAYRKLQQKFHSERWSVNDCLGEYGLYYDEKRGQTAEIEEFDIKVGLVFITRNINYNTMKTYYTKNNLFLNLMVV